MVTFILNCLYDHAVIPEVIYTGAKIMSIRIPQLDRKVLDSLNLLPMALAKLPKTFGLTELKKGFFPHFVNTKANQKYQGALPEAKFYGPDSMSPERRTEFYVWYEIEKMLDLPFNLQCLLRE